MARVNDFRMAALLDGAPPVNRLERRALAKMVSRMQAYQRHQMRVLHAKAVRKAAAFMKQKMQEMNSDKNDA